MSKQRECTGDEESGCFQTSVEGCAIACENRSSMFVYGIAGSSRCLGSKCKCLCETGAKVNGTCTETSHSGYHLYKYKPGESRSDMYFIIHYQIIIKILKD